MAKGILLNNGNPIDSDSLTALDVNVLDGFTFIGYQDSEPKEGTMPNRGSVERTFTPNSSTQVYTIPIGYHDGGGKVTVNPVPTQEKSVTPSSANQTITPDYGMYLSRVNVAKIPTQTKRITSTPLRCAGNNSSYGVEAQIGVTMPIKPVSILYNVEQFNAKEYAINWVCVIKGRRVGTNTWDSLCSVTKTINSNASSKITDTKSISTGYYYDLFTANFTDAIRSNQYDNYIVVTGDVQF